MDWIMLAVLAGLSSNIFNFLNRFVLKNDHEDPTAFGWFTEFSRLLAFGFLLLFDFKLTALYPTIPVLILLGLTNLASTYVFMKMHAFTHLSLSTIISRLRLVWVAVLAFFITGEVLQMHQYAGIALLFLGLNVAVAPHKLAYDKGIKYALLSSIILPVMAIFQKMATPYASIPLIVLFMSLPGLVYPFFMKDAKRRIVQVFHTNLLAKLGASTANIGAMYLYVLALKSGPVSIVTAIYQGMMIVSIIAGIVLLKEREDVIKRILGALLTLGGILIITYK